MIRCSSNQVTLFKMRGFLLCCICSYLYIFVSLITSQSYIASQELCATNPGGTFPATFPVPSTNVARLTPMAGAGKRGGGGGGGPSGDSGGAGVQSGQGIARSTLITNATKTGNKAKNKTKIKTIGAVSLPSSASATVEAVPPMADVIFCGSNSQNHNLNSRYGNFPSSNSLGDATISQLCRLSYRLITILSQITSF